MQFSVTADLRAVERDLERLQGGVLPRVTAQALNRTNTGIVTEVVRAVSQRYGIKPMKRVRRRVFIPRGAAWRATPARLIAGGRLLFAFLPRFWIDQSEGRNRFVADMPSGHRGVFSRKGAHRLPIAEQFVDKSAEVAHMTERLIDTAGRERFRKAWEQAARRALARGR